MPNEITQGHQDNNYEIACQDPTFEMLFPAMYMDGPVTSLFSSYKIAVPIFQPPSTADEAWCQVIQVLQMPTSCSL